MPTGYTHDVSTGKVSEFRDFVLACARAFGALILMRDDPADAEIPQRFEPSTYYRDALEKARLEIARLETMTPADVDAACSEAHDTALKAWSNREAERREVEQRYRAMLAEVEAWQPPTADHVELKNFMRQQLLESIDFDCKTSVYDAEPQRPSPPEWHAERVKQAHESTARYAAEWEKEQARTESRNRWLDALRDSLSVTADVTETR